ncbi:flagellar hook-length control protein FliK [Clostridium algifaecis]|uniref:Flagellar hook-length control protein FliK n=1 Tax=Clostridium algifaecis TaxID=1472040 RepID=A0ABS4KMW7_9CLOT|nr:flagellar hook-length control protein FliK [Clostridium algifaecis]MBP2031383.1 flagellar hook-length control protein FliK [Clostridium algifaecis]
MNVTSINTMASVNAATASTSGAKSYSSNSDKSFKSLVQNSTDNKSNIQDNSTTVNKNDSQCSTSVKSENSSEDVNTKDEDSKIESYLKQAGFSDDEIKSIKDEIKSGKIDEKNILSLLSLLFSNNQNVQKNLDNSLNKLADEISDKISNSLTSSKDSLQNLLNLLNSSTGDGKNISDVLNKACGNDLKLLSSILSKSDKGAQLAEKLSEKIADSITSKISKFISSTDMSKNSNADLKSQIYTELLSKLDSKSESNLNTQENAVNNKLLQMSNKDGNIIKGFETENTNLGDKTSNNKNEGNSGFTGSSNNDKKILSKILDGGKTDNKISRATNFMSQFNTVKGDNNIAVKNGAQEITLNKTTFNSDIIKTVKYMDLNNIKQLTVKITPKELGEITINLTMEDGKMKAALTASNKDAYNILNSNLQDLSNRFENNDIKVQGFSLNLYHEDTTFFNDESKKWSQSESGKKNKNLSVSSLSDDEEIPQEDYYGDNNVNILA